ncbi:hypothetical protein [Streptomyces sp. AC555_RSS877]|uniref:hypothetical protein n=1 Tax=Streptomyces sp. AC555_RSS877 TaxID=2823688 RepID=UPI001C280792|nr:hypothetical protein [Streptomyces sp. AC555_RSS877]
MTFVGAALLHACVRARFGRLIRLTAADVVGHSPAGAGVLGAVRGAGSVALTPASGPAQSSLSPLRTAARSSSDANPA